MKTGRRIVAILMVAVNLMVLFATANTQIAQAAETASVTASGGSCTVGGKVKVTVKVSASANLGIVMFDLVYDAAALTFVGSDVNGTYREADSAVEGKSKTYTYEFVGNKAGTYTIKVVASTKTVLPMDPAVGDYFDSVSVSNATVTVNPPYSASKNANLGKLSVGEGTLSPAFSKDTTSYTVNVDGAVTALTISAKSEDGKGKVSVSGNKDLKEGANTVTVTCTAEDGKTKKTYTITVNRGPAPTPTPTPTPTPGLSVHVGDAERTLNGEFEGDLPEGFTPATVEMNGFTVAVATGEDGTTKLVQMDDGRLYVMAGENQYYLYQMVESPARRFSVIPKPDDTPVPKGFVEDTDQLFGPNVTVWKAETDPAIVLLYLRDSNGEAGWFLYDMNTKSVMNYHDTMFVPSPTPIPTPEPEPTPTEPVRSKPDTNPDQPSDTGAKDSFFAGLSTREFVGAVTIIGLLVLLIIFLILFLRERGNHTEEPMIIDDFDEDEEMNKTFDPRLLLTEEEEEEIERMNQARANREKAKNTLKEAEDILAELADYENDDV